MITPFKISSLGLAVNEYLSPVNIYKTWRNEVDKKLNKIYDAYKSGKMTSGEIKQLTIEKMEIFMDNFLKGMEKAKKQISSLKFVKFK